MPGTVSTMSVQVDTLAARQAVSDSVVRKIARRVDAQEDLLRTSRAETGSRMEELLTRNETVAANLDEATRQVSLLQERLTSIDARLERFGGAGDSLSDASRAFLTASEARAAGDNAAAADGFQRAVDALGGSPLAAEALYQLGEAREATKAYEGALKAYRAVVSQYGASPRVPRAMYRAAMVLETLKERSAATETLRNLVKAYPDSPDAVAARDHLAASSKPKSTR